VIKPPFVGNTGFVMSEAEAALAPFFAAPAAEGQATVDERRLRKIVNANLDFIWRCLRRLGIPSAEVDDAVQQVFLVAAAKLGTIAPGSERAFLFATASRIAANARRSVHRRDDAHHRLMQTETMTPPSPEELTDRLRARELMDRVLEQMPTELREVFVLFELEELSITELSELLSIPIGTVGSRLRRAREDFQSRVRRMKAAGAGRGMR